MKAGWYHLLDHWNSISRFRGGPLLLWGNKAYSPATDPSITTRSIWIVTFPNLLCQQRHWLRNHDKRNLIKNVNYVKSYEIHLIMTPRNKIFEDEYTAAFTTCFCTFTFPTLLLFLQEIWSFWPLGGLSKVHEKLSSHSGLGPVETTCHPIIKDISNTVYSLFMKKEHT